MSWHKCEVLRHPLYFRDRMKIGSAIDMPNSVNRAVGGAYNAIRLSSALPAERSVCNARTTFRPSLIDAAASNWRAHESHAH
jgi:hypothetical protein